MGSLLTLRKMLLPQSVTHDSETLLPSGLTRRWGILQRIKRDGLLPHLRDSPVWPRENLDFWSQTHNSASLELGEPEGASRGEGGQPCWCLGPMLHVCTLSPLTIEMYQFTTEELWRRSLKQPCGLAKYFCSKQSIRSEENKTTDIYWVLINNCTRYFAAKLSQPYVVSYLAE